VVVLQDYLGALGKLAGRSGRGGIACGGAVVGQGFLAQLDGPLYLLLAQLSILEGGLEIVILVLGVVNGLGQTVVELAALKVERAGLCDRQRLGVGVDRRLELAFLELNLSDPAQQQGFLFVRAWFRALW